MEYSSTELGKILLHSTTVNMLHINKLNSISPGTIIALIILVDKLIF
jgi:hypothetical protein